MNPPLRIGIAGLGTVGAGVARLLDVHADLIEQRVGRRIVVSAVSARDRGRDRGVDLSAVRWFEDAEQLAADREVDVVVEVIGGSSGKARSVVDRAIEAGKPVVTANKALLALHGEEILRAAEGKRVALGFEAAVAGGIPVIKGIREGLGANRIEAVYGILNGTCNFILSEMQRSFEAGAPHEFSETLAEAQRLGYAESDPSFDIDGIDAAHKLAILAGLAFNAAVDFHEVHVEGIRHVSALDIRYADELGMRIKLLGIARRGVQGLELRVHPTMIAKEAPLASVEGVFNAVVAKGDFVGQVAMIGRGAGAGPTASAVVADIMDIARGYRAAPFGVGVDRLTHESVVPIEKRHGAYYLRLMVLDRPGVIADVAAAMRDHEISVEGLLQRGRSPGDAVPIVITTHETDEAAMRHALGVIEGLEAVLEPPRMIRIESL